MINGANEIRILLNGNKLSEVVTKTFNQTSTILEGHYRKQIKRGELSNRDLQKKSFFMRFFCEEYLSGKHWSGNELEGLYSLCLKFSGDKDESKVREALSYKVDDIRPRITNYFYQKSIRPGLSLFFFLLWRNRAVLLTMQYASPLPFLTSASNFTRYLSPTIKFALSFNPRIAGEPETDILYKKLRTKEKCAQNSGYWLRVFLCTDWYSFSNIDSAEFIALHGTSCLADIKKRLLPISTGLNINLLLLCLQAARKSQLDNKLANYSYVKEPSQKSKKERRRKKKSVTQRIRKASKSSKITRKENAIGQLNDLLMQNKEISVKDLHTIFVNHYELAYEVFADENDIQKVCDAVSTHYLSHSLLTWWKLFQAFLKKSKYEREQAPLSSFKHFLYYLLYLDVYYLRTTNEALPSYPSKPETLVGAYFISRPLDIKNAPLSFLEFMAEIQIVSEWSNDTLYSKFKTLELFFAYIERYSEQLEGCSGFKQPLYPDDYPKVMKRPWTSKTPLPSRFFKTLISFVYALKLVQDRLVEMIESGEWDYVDFVNTYPKQGGYINFEMMSYAIGFTPVCWHNGRYYPIRELFRFFRYGQYEIEGHDEEIETIWPGDLYICILMLETGIRQKHLRWLDVDNWDLLVDFNEPSDVHPLFVNTDKVHGPWIASVSSRVINILSAMRSWRAKVKTEGFKQEKFYNNNLNSKFGKVSAIFSFNEDGLPPSDVTNCWNAIMLSFQSFLRGYGLLDRSFIKLTPPNFKINENVIKDRVVKSVAYTAEELPYTPLSYSCLHTPHACRATVISEYITVLPPSYIGKNITGQHERLVTYYVKIDKDRMRASQVAQWGITSAPVLEEEMNDVPHAENPNSKMAKMLKTEPEEAIKQFGLISMTTEDRNETGIDLIKKKKAVNLALNPTHICPYSNNCPEHIVKRLKGFNKCYICPAAIKGSQHICAISAAKDKANEQLKTAQFTLNDIRKATPTAEDLISETEKQIDELAIEAMSWEYTENLLHREMKVKGGLVYIVEDQEEVSAHLERYAMDDAVSYLIKRLRDSVHYPSLTSPEVKAKFAHAKRKLLIAHGKLKEAFKDSPDVDPASELYGLIKSYMDIYDMPMAHVFALLRMPIEEIIEKKPSVALLNEEI